MISICGRTGGGEHGLERAAAALPAAASGHPSWILASHNSETTCDAVAGCLRGLIQRHHLNKRTPHRRVPVCGWIPGGADVYAGGPRCHGISRSWGWAQILPKRVLPVDSRSSQAEPRRSATPFSAAFRYDRGS